MALCVQLLEPTSERVTCSRYISESTVLQALGTRRNRKVDNSQAVPEAWELGGSGFASCRRPRWTVSRQCTLHESSVHSSDVTKLVEKDVCQFKWLYLISAPC